ncbi:MAG: ATP synthase F1 subunit delta [Coriobacteriales bacterium]|jgi:F-type H+-transporting ATPase subunit delta|nr:ATP synthase F1 subunit delta [Coriobacteriales bacterium]
MKTSAVNIRAKAEVYARVLLEAAQASDRVFVLTGELAELLATVRGSLELRSALSEATFPEQAKKAIIAEIFSDYAPELLATFEVMVERGDLATLPRVCEFYYALAEEALGAIILDVSTVVPLDEELRQQIITKYSSQLGRGVLLREYIDPDLIGGIVLASHGKRIDASVSSQLENARQVLSLSQ